MENRYGRLDRLLHHLALGAESVRALSFDVNQAFAPSGERPDRQQAHVFVTGLARSGTSILLDVLFRSGDFETLTYRHMPFVLAPNLWARLNRSHRYSAKGIERAHGDGIRVDFDSPEAFEEVFWITFCRKYIQSKGINIQSEEDVSEEILVKFERFVRNVISSSGDGRSDKRYLSKNNNNIVRLHALRRAFPRAHILIPFRNPVDHARSLFRQHQRFCQMQSADSYTRKYMNWLAHHEFGLDHKPFLVPHIESTLRYDPSDINYWLSYWINIHQYLINSVPDRSIFICHDSLCAYPERYLTRLGERLGLEKDALDSSVFSERARQSSEGCDPGLLEAASRLRDQLEGLDLLG